MRDDTAGDELVDRLEDELRASAVTWLGPKEGECLLCFVARMLEEFGCDHTLRWAARFRDLRVPAATALERRLGERGGYCDCEVFLNGFQLAPHLWVLDEYGDPVAPQRLPACAEVRRTSTQPCGHWVRRRRDWF